MTVQIAATPPQVGTSRLTPVAVCGAILFCSIAITSVAIALPRIATDLGTQPALLQGVLDAFTLALAISSLIAGMLVARIGARATFTIGAIILAGATGLSAIAPTLIVLDGARLVAGLGAGTVLTGGASLLSTVYEGPRRARMFAAYGASGGAGLAFGPVVAAALIALIGWRGILGALAGALALIAIACVRLPRTPHSGHGTAGVGLRQLLRNRRYLGLLLVGLAGAGGYIPVQAYLATALSAVYGIGTSASALLLLPLTVPVLVGPILAGRAVTVWKLHPDRVILVSLLLLVVGDLGLALVRPEIPVAVAVVPLIAVGFGFGLGLGLADGEALATAGPMAGAAAGIFNFGRTASEAVFLAAFGAAAAGLIAAMIGPYAAPAIAAGQPGHGDVYAAALTELGLTLGGLMTLVTITVHLLLRRRRTSLDR
jgi:predicted MFS family arabinose efflux permease